MLIEADAAIFAELVAGEVAPPLRLAEPGWETPEVLQMLQAIAVNVRKDFTPAAWLIVESGDVIGLCSIMNVLQSGETIEIGYGIAPSRRGRGAARRAVADVLAWAREDPRVARITANTAVNNHASQCVLERNGFTKTATAANDDDGELICWQINLADQSIPVM
jgi:RimJ/RimL family protein N-acetyltransferase